MWDIIGKLTVGFVLCRFGWSVVKGLYGSFIAAALGLNLNLKKMGKWAVVTGATDGIGKAYAFELASKGINLVLISRTPFKLQNVSAEITTKHGVEVKIIDVDFTRKDIYDRIQKELTGMDIGILINNVGMNYDYPDFFENIDSEKVDQLINCNIVSVNMMTSIVLPRMVEQRRGLVVNIASLSATIPAPFLAVYAATKSYVESLSQSLLNEYSSKGVIFQCVLPGFVVSNMSKLKTPSLMAPTPAAYVRSQFKTTGVENRTAGYFMHKLQIYFIEFADVYLPGLVLKQILYHQLNGMRIRGLKRKERELKSQ